MSSRLSPPKKRTKTDDTHLKRTKYDEKRIDIIYSKLKNFLQRFKGNPKNDLLDFSTKMYDDIYGASYDKNIDNNLYNFEVLLSILRYLSRTKRPFNKRRIKLLGQFVFNTEENGITNIFKSASYKTDSIFITITDKEYFKVAKEYLKKIAERFNGIDTRSFTDNIEFRRDPFF